MANAAGMEAGRAGKRGRSRRYDPRAEPLPLPEGFVEKVQGVLLEYVAEFRSLVSWLDGQMDLPLAELAVDLRLDRTFGKRGAPDVDDMRVHVLYHVGGGGQNIQRYTWQFSEAPGDAGEVRVRAYTRRRQKEEGGGMNEREGEKEVSELEVASAGDVDVAELASDAIVASDQGADSLGSPGLMAGEAGVREVGNGDSNTGEVAACAAAAWSPEVETPVPASVEATVEVMEGAGGCMVLEAGLSGVALSEVAAKRMEVDDGAGGRGGCLETECGGGAAREGETDVAEGSVIALAAPNGSGFVTDQSPHRRTGRFGVGLVWLIVLALAAVAIAGMWSWIAAVAGAEARRPPEQARWGVGGVRGPSRRAGYEMGTRDWKLSSLAAAAG